MADRPSAPRLPDEDYEPHRDLTPASSAVATLDGFRPIRISERDFHGVMAELHRRSLGRREAGAFLLGPTRGPEIRTVSRIAYYDDLDPHCLTGGISFRAIGYTALATLCRREGVRAIGDVHLHPRAGVSQSKIDARHPMVAVSGHVALIVPNFGQGVDSSHQLGAHVKTPQGWWSSYGADVDRVLTVTPSRSIPRQIGRGPSRFVRSLPGAPRAKRPPR